MSDLSSAIMGGGLIALSSSSMYVLYGRITGLSGILFGFCNFSVSSSFFYLCLSFIAGLISSINFWVASYGKYRDGFLLVSETDNLSTVGWMIGGLLIGTGARWSGGCTSGHGVCGLPRLSKRSLIAISIFMPVGMVTGTYLSQNPVFFTNVLLSPEFNDNYKYFANLAVRGLQMAFGIISLYFVNKEDDIASKFAPLANFVLGGVFGLGLLISGMCNRLKILGFLTISANWDPSLIVVMFTAVFINFFTFQAIIANGKSLLNYPLARPDSRIDLGIFVGPVLFGLGWGITGLCPGPALANLLYNPHSLLLIITIFSGQKIVDAVYDLLRPKSKFN